jgi:hypothetical protein
VPAGRTTGSGKSRFVAENVVASKLLPKYQCREIHEYCHPTLIVR